MSFKLVNVTHRHCVFTIDARLRDFFLNNRSLLDCLFHAVSSVVSRMFFKQNKSMNFTPNFIMVLHTFCKDLKWNPRIRRMDSMMIEANIKNLSRAELLYSCVAKLARCLHKAERNDLLEGLEHYYDPNDFNRTFYYNDSTETEDIMKTVLENADRLLVLGRDDFSGTGDYQLLERCLSEQTITEGGASADGKEERPFS